MNMLHNIFVTYSGILVIAGLALLYAYYSDNFHTMVWIIYMELIWLHLLVWACFLAATETTIIYDGDLTYMLGRITQYARILKGNGMY